MITWNNLDTVKAYEALKKVDKVKLAEVMSGENGAARVKKYSVPMAEGLAYNYAAKQVDDNVLKVLFTFAQFSRARYMARGPKSLPPIPI